MFGVSPDEMKLLIQTKSPQKIIVSKSNLFLTGFIKEISHKIIMYSSIL